AHEPSLATSRPRGRRPDRGVRPRSGDGGAAGDALSADLRGHGLRVARELDALEGESTEDALREDARHHARRGSRPAAARPTDRPGLLALFTAALAANGIDILGAEVNSLAGGTALDTFVVREAGGGAPSPARWEAARNDLLRLLSGADDPHRLVQKRLRRATWASSAAPAVETKVRVDDVSSETMTILDVLTQDRPGLLHTIADALHRAGVSSEV